MERMGRDRIWNKGKNLHWPYSNTGKKWKGKGLFFFFFFFGRINLVKIKQLWETAKIKEGGIGT